MKVYPEITDLTKQEVQEYPLGAFEHKIIVIDKTEDVPAAVEYLIGQKILGVDTETRPSFKKGKRYKLSLLQVSSADRCYLFRLNYLGFPSLLFKFLENQSIIKVGAALHDDLKDLRRLRNFEPRGFLDLQKWVTKFGISALSVQKLSAVVLGFKISKSQRLSNWDKDVLTPAQKSYAATDAWVCLEIFKKLQPLLKEQ